MKKLYRSIFIVIILIANQISFKNFGHGILHNQIDDTNPDEINRLNTGKLIETTKNFIESILITEDDTDDTNNNDQKSVETVKPFSDDNLELKQDEIQLQEITESAKIYSDLESIDTIQTQEVPPKTQESDIQVDQTNVEISTSEQVSSDQQHVTINNQIQKKNKLDIESFEEWKYIKLKEEAKIKAEIYSSKTEKKSSVALNPSDKTEFISNTNHSVIDKKNGDEEDDDSHIIIHHRKNYASPDCGAKLVGNNPEANHASHILLESKDDYMLNSCSNKIWFSIELCEPIKINTFELANLELFSNVPRLFRVYASERFIQSSSTKDWPSKYLIGTFEAKNVRSIQSFSVDKDSIKLTNDSLNSTSNSENFPSPIVIYAKYVRFEMLSHYGNEHYCPLSLVRIYGSSMSDDQEEVHEDDEVTMTINKNQEKQILDNSDIGPNTAPSVHFSKTASVLTEISVLFYNNLVSILTEKFHKNMDRFLTSLGDFQQFKTKSSTSVIDADDFDITNLDVYVDLYNLMCYCNSFIENQFIDCCRCLKSFENASKLHTTNDTFNWLNDKCGYFFLMSTKNNKHLDRYISNMKFSLPATGVQTEVFQDERNYFKLTINKINYFIENTWLKGNIQRVKQNYSLRSNEDMINQNITEEIPKTIHDDDLKDFNTNLNEEISDSTEPALKSNLEQVPENNPNIDSSSSNIIVNNDEVLQGVVIVEEQTLADEQFIIDETQKEFTSAIEEKLDKTTNPPVVLTSSSLTTENPVEETSTTEASTRTTTSTIKPLTVTKESLIVYGKEAVLVRLNNRIKILELNMSLSSQYLEKLSQHYRIQMEEMETTFNFTTSALKEATRVSDERDQKQQMKIIELEKRLEILQQAVDSLGLYIENITYQTNLLSLAVTILIALTVFVEVTKKICSNKRKRTRTKSYSDTKNIQLSQSQIEIIIEKKFNSLMKSKKMSFCETVALSNKSDEVETLGQTKA